MSNPKQQSALRYMLQGHNVFLTGAAGTGKSYTIDLICKALRKLGKTVCVTATTGIAASNIGGTTLHAWAKIRLGTHHGTNVHKYCQDLRRFDCAQNWLITDVLVIDEISMLDIGFFCLLNRIAQELRVRKKRDRNGGFIRRPGKTPPFGGIQLLLCGDFFQLPPVKGTQYLFENPVWEKVVHKTVHLDQVYRQQDSKFVSLLMAVREGKQTEEHVKMIKNINNCASPKNDRVKPTRLFCTRVNVAVRNRLELDKLPGDVCVVKSRDEYPSRRFENRYSKLFRFPVAIELKVDAQVMILLNTGIDGVSLVNGTRGVVVKLPTKKDDRVHVYIAHANKVIGLTRFKEEFENGSVSRSQFPIQLAWALTIHKAQGLTIDVLDVDLAGCFADAQAYVALSRGTDMSHMRVFNFCAEKSIKVSPKVKAFYDN